MSPTSTQLYRKFSFLITFLQDNFSIILQRPQDGHRALPSHWDIFLECLPYILWFSVSLPQIYCVCTCSDKPNTVDDGNESAMRFSQKVVPGKAQLTTFNGIKSWSQQVNVNSLTHQPSTEIGNSIILLTGMAKEKALGSRFLPCNWMPPLLKRSTITQKNCAALNVT